MIIHDQICIDLNVRAVLTATDSQVTHSSGPAIFESSVYAVICARSQGYR